MELVRERRWGPAFALAEEILDAEPAVEDLRTLGNPWAGPPPTSPAVLAGLRRAARGPRAGWAWLLLSRALRDREARQDAARRASAMPARRYGWMGYWTACTYFNREDLELAASELRRAVSRPPVNWWAYGTLAEVLVCLGRPREALAQFAPALRSAPPLERPQVVAWRGMVKLWLGRSAAALVDLDRACAAGVEHALAWRGAAKVLSGRPRQAVPDLEEAVRLGAHDDEARVWLSAAWRAVGQPERALDALPARSASTWVEIERALDLAALGRREAFGAAFGRLPSAFVERLAAGPAPEGFQARRQLLEGAARAARGCRIDSYDHAAWLR